MAKYIPGGERGEMRGSVGSDTYSRNRFGTYVRHRGIPVNPNTAIQTFVRDLCSDLATTYKTLTAGQREGWQELADQLPRTDSLGQGYTQTGAQLFVGANFNRRFYLNFGVVSNAPAAPQFGAFEITAFTLQGAAPPGSPLTITALTTNPASPGSSDQADVWLVRMTGPRSPGASFVGRQAFRAISRTVHGTIFPASAAIDDGDNLDDYAARWAVQFGGATIGQRVDVEVSLMTGLGIQSSAQRRSAIIAAPPPP